MLGHLTVSDGGSESWRPCLRSWVGTRTRGEWARALGRLAVGWGSGWWRGQALISQAWSSGREEPVKGGSLQRPVPSALWKDGFGLRCVRGSESASGAQLTGRVGRRGQPGKTWCPWLGPRECGIARALRFNPHQLESHVSLKFPGKTWSVLANMVNGLPPQPSGNFSMSCWCAASTLLYDGVYVYMFASLSDLWAPENEVLLLSDLWFFSSWSVAWSSGGACCRETLSKSHCTALDGGNPSEEQLSSPGVLREFAEPGCPFTPVLCVSFGSITMCLLSRYLCWPEALQCPFVKKFPRCSRGEPWVHGALQGNCCSSSPGCQEVIFLHCQVRSTVRRVLTYRRDLLVETFAHRLNISQIQQV